MEKPEVKSNKMRKRKREEDSSAFEDSLVGEPHAKAPVEKGKAVRHESDVDEEIEQSFLTEKPEVKSHQKKRNVDSGTFEESLDGEPQAKSPDEKGQAESKTSDSSTFEDSLVGGTQAKSPVAKGKAESRTSDSMGHEEATDLGMVDTCHKVKPFIPVYFGVSEPLNPDVVPQGPVVFLWNLSPEVKYLDLENLFKDCGKIRHIRFILDEYQLFDGAGYVEFETRGAAEKAFKLHGVPLNGQPVTLMLGNPWGAQLDYEVEYSRDLEPESNCRHTYRW